MDIALWCYAIETPWVLIWIILIGFPLFFSLPHIGLWLCCGPDIRSSSCLTEWQIILDMDDDDHTFAQHFRIPRLAFPAYCQEGAHVSVVHGQPELLVVDIWQVQSLDFISIPLHTRSADHHVHHGRGFCLLAYRLWEEGVCHQLPAHMWPWGWSLERRIHRPPVRGGDYMKRKSYYSVLLLGDYWCWRQLHQHLH